MSNSDSEFCFIFKARAQWVLVTHPNYHSNDIEVKLYLFSFLLFCVLETGPCSITVWLTICYGVQSGLELGVFLPLSFEG